MALTAVDGRPAVQEYDGLIAIWAGTSDDPTGIAMSPAAAFEVARDMLALAPGGGADTTGVVDRISIMPPAAEGMTGRLRIHVAGGATVDLLLDWPNLVGLADAAQKALTAASPQGQA